MNAKLRVNGKMFVEQWNRKTKIIFMEEEEVPLNSELDSSRLDDESVHQPVATG